MNRVILFYFYLFLRIFQRASCNLANSRAAWDKITQGQVGWLVSENISVFLFPETLPRKAFRHRPTQ